VLADESERVEDINAGEARAELEKAQHDLPKAGASEEDWERANAAIARATVRVQAAEKSGGGSGAARELQSTH
jgi:F0F1-type ATP synthase epsilon subunit